MHISFVLAWFAEATMGQLGSLMRTSGWRHCLRKAIRSKQSLLNREMRGDIDLRPSAHGQIAIDRL
jgi:hypothetical protein